MGVTSSYSCSPGTCHALWLAHRLHTCQSDASAVRLPASLPACPPRPSASRPRDASFSCRIAELLSS